jgi:hypothetical protein
MAGRVAAVALVVGALAAGPAAAAGVTGGAEFRVNTYTTGAQDDAAVAVQGATVMVAWESPQDGSGDGIYARAAGRGGSAAEELLVNTYTTGAQDDPAIAALSDGTFIVLWESTGQDGSGEGLYGRLLSAGGEPTGAEFAVNTHTAGNQDTPAVAALADGGFVAVWEDPLDGDGEALMAQRFDAAGGRRGAELRINEGTVGDQQEPAIATSAGGFVVTWVSTSDEGADGSGAAVMARRFDLEGAALGDDILVNTYTTGDQTHPVVAATDEGFVVAWASDGQDGSADGIFAQRFDQDGARLGEEFQVNTYTTGVQLWPAVAAREDGVFMVIWESAGPDGSSDAVMGRLYGRDGAVQGPERTVNVISAGAQEDASIAVDARGGFLVVWESADGSSDGVSGRRVGGWPAVGSDLQRGAARRK